MLQEGLEEKLVVVPESRYELEIGEINSLDLGQFVGNDIKQVFVFYQISEASDTSLKADFSVDFSYEKEIITLEIDLTQMNPRMADESVIGELSIWNLAHENATYEIEFMLICTDKDKCKIPEAFKGVEIPVFEEVKEP